VGMVTEMPKKSKKRKKRTTHSIEVEFSDEKVTSFGGMVLQQRAAMRLRLWSILAHHLPERSGDYSWLEVVQSMIAGLLTGARGTFVAEDLREDEALLELLGLPGAPEEATVWRCLDGLGELTDAGVFQRVQTAWVRKILRLLPRRDLLECEGFLPVFADGSLLEGSTRREGSKYIPQKGAGLMWATVFVGPLVARQALAKKGEGEESLIRSMLGEVVKEVLKPLKLQERALLLADSLHGDGPTLDEAERLGLHYVVGAGGLKKTHQTLRDLPESQWHDLGANKKRGWESSAVCQCWLQCDGWAHKRLLIGRRVRRQGEMFETYYGVLTNLTEADLKNASGLDLIKRVWRLYDAKGRMELGYQELLSDLGLHHPPCREHRRNAGFYSVATLAHTLGAAVKLIGLQADQKHQREQERLREKREGAPPRVHVRPRRGMRLWRVRRRLFALPGRVSWHARRMKVTLLGVGPGVREQFERWRHAIARC